MENFPRVVAQLTTTQVKVKKVVSLMLLFCPSLTQMTLFPIEWFYLFLKVYINWIIQHVIFCAFFFFLLLNYVVDLPPQYVWWKFTFIARKYSFVRLFHNLYFSFTVNRHLCWYQFLDTTDTAYISIYISRNFSLFLTQEWICWGRRVWMFSSRRYT